MYSQLLEREPIYMQEEHIPLILISGIMCTEKLWEKQLLSFSNKIKTVIPKVTQKKSIHDLAAEIIGENNYKFNAIGFSSGGYIAQEIIRQSPQSINKLILMNTSGGEYSKQHQKVRKNFIDICKTQGATKGLQKFFDKINSTYMNCDPTIVEFNKKMVEESNPEIFFWQFKAVYDFNITAPLLKKITCPTKVIVSADDPFVTKEAYEEMEKSIPNVEVVVLENGGHMLPISRPSKIIDLIIYFFDYS